MALGWWIVVLVVEGLWCVGSAIVVASGSFPAVSLTPPVVVPPVLVGLQVMLFVQARRDRR